MPKPGFLMPKWHLGLMEKVLSDLLSMYMASLFIPIYYLYENNGKQMNNESFVVNTSRCYFPGDGVLLWRNELTMDLLQNCLAAGDTSRMGCSNPKSMIDVSFTSSQWIILLISLNSSWYCCNLCLNPSTAYSESLLALRARGNSLPAG